MKNIVKRFFPAILVLCHQISVLGQWLPKKKNLILCGAMAGNYYGDNSRYVYEYLNKHHPEISCIWITRNKSVVKALQAKGSPVCYMYSLRSIILLFRCRLALYTNNLADIAAIPTLAPKSMMLLALRHGRSVKKVRFASNKKLSFSERYMVHKETLMIKGAVSTSSFVSSIQEAVLSIGNEKHFVTGYPRNDILMTPSIPESVAKLRGSFSKVFLYGPTWRHGEEPVRFFPFEDFSFDALNNFLVKTNSLMILRAHKNEMKLPSVRECLTKLAKSKNVIILDHQDIPSVNDLLPVCDCLISDYSALYHDYLLLDRPLIMVPYDLEKMLQDRGFLYDYVELCPGPIINNFTQFIYHMQSVVDNRDEYRIQRSKLAKLIHDNVDAESTKRVVSLAQAFLNQKT